MKIEPACFHPPDTYLGQFDRIWNEVEVYYGEDGEADYEEREAIVETVRKDKVFMKLHKRGYFK